MTLDWKWIAIGAVIMLALSVLGGLVTAMVLGSQLEGVTNVDDVNNLSLSNGQMALIAIINFLAFLIGGLIVGWKSAGRTIIEPGISAALAVIVGLLIAGSLSVFNVIAAGLVPFLAGILGGWLGERRNIAAVPPATRL